MKNTHNYSVKMMAIMVSPIHDNPPFADKKLYQELSMLGKQEGIEVYIFSPNKVDWNIRKVEGYKYCSSKDSWVTHVFSLPRLIYDRTYFHDQAVFEACRSSISRLKKDRSILWLGHNLNNKWDVLKVLQRNALFQSYLPDTKKLLDINNVLLWLNHKNDLILKPITGSQGKGVLHIHAQNKETYAVVGRNHRNQQIAWSFSNANLFIQKLKNFITNRSYLMQQYLHLRTHDGIAYDIRSLMQKDNLGRWQLTGLAVRKGLVGSLTANLHGGGTAAEALPFLQAQFGREKAKEIIGRFEQLSTMIPSFLEQYYGRLVELGIDFGVEPNGEIWILEVNSKPGKSIFAFLNNKEVRTRSLHNPIRYARSILDRQLGG